VTGGDALSRDKCFEIKRTLGFFFSRDPTEQISNLSFHSFKQTKPPVGQKKYLRSDSYRTHCHVYGGMCDDNDGVWFG
jgi:hypothetical protein